MAALESSSWRKGEILIIYVSIQLAEGDNMQETPNEIADGVLRAVGGDEAKDTCQITIMQPSVPGVAGVPIAPPTEP
jgi:hypothetical protein